MTRCATGLESAVTTPGGPGGGRRQRDKAHAGPPGESHTREAARRSAARRGGRREVAGSRSRRSESSGPVAMERSIAVLGVGFLRSFLEGRVWKVMLGWCGEWAFK
jgi:hypothetical protein